MAQTSPDFARIASRTKLTTSKDRRALLQHYTSLTLIAMILTGLALFIVRIPRAHAVGVQAATNVHSTSALRKSLHDLHNPNNDNWHHAALPVLILFLSVMGFGVLFTLAILILPYCVKGAEARLSYLGDAMTSAVTTTTARMPLHLVLLGTRGLGGLNPLCVAGLICFLWWAAPRFWKAIAMDGQQASSGHAATLAREARLRYADDSFGDCLCGQCLSKLCADCLVKVKRHSVETSSAKDDGTVDDDEVEEGWYDVANDSEVS
ncbi:hypothetical protein LTR74_015563 [Friedmanniomyces endolithicus]|nr:hypothetical protein LTR74_015563 [Friedmanniomyces endolithicus]